MYSIDKNKCRGCGLCVKVCAEGIKMEGNKAVIIKQGIDCLKKAEGVCPIGIIIDSEKNNKN